MLELGMREGRGFYPLPWGARRRGWVEKVAPACCPPSTDAKGSSLGVYKPPLSQYREPSITSLTAALSRGGSCPMRPSPN